MNEVVQHFLNRCSNHKSSSSDFNWEEKKKRFFSFNPRHYFLSCLSLCAFLPLFSSHSLGAPVLTKSTLTCVCVSGGPKMREMSSGHEAGAKTCCPAAHWAGWERPVGGAEQSMPPPTLRPESYRFLLCVKSRCWWTRKGNGGAERGKRQRVWEMEQEAESSDGSCHLPSSLPPSLPLPACLKLHTVTCRRSQTEPLHLLSSPLRGPGSTRKLLTAETAMVLDRERMEALPLRSAAGWKSAGRPLREKQHWCRPGQSLSWAWSAQTSAGQTDWQSVTGGDIFLQIKSSKIQLVSQNTENQMKYRYFMTHW